VNKALSNGIVGRFLLLSAATRGNGALVAPGSERAAGDLRKWLTCCRLRTIYALWELEFAGMGRILWFAPTGVTSMSSTAGSPGTPVSGIETLRAKSGWIVALGAVYVIAGIVAIGSVVLATVATVFIVGIMMLVAGVAEVINAFQIKTWGKFILWLLLGALYIVAGLLTFENPLLAAAILTLFLGFSLIASGIMRVVLALSMQQAMPWVWVLLSGIVTFLLGLLIVAHWPVSSLYILGLFLGIDLVIAGAGWIGIGLGLRRRA
jgi:uncharacterized membrane protein HdeD (DUF308 family)